RAPAWRGSLPLPEPLPYPLPSGLRIPLKRGRDLRFCILTPLGAFLREGVDLPAFPYRPVPPVNLNANPENAHGNQEGNELAPTGLRVSGSLRQDHGLHHFAPNNQLGRGATICDRRLMTHWRVVPTAPPGRSESIPRMIAAIHSCQFRR